MFIEVETYSKLWQQVAIAVLNLGSPENLEQQYGFWKMDGASSMYLVDWTIYGCYICVEPSVGLLFDETIWKEIKMGEK